MHLQNLIPAAQSAHNNVSFSPEERGKRLINDLENTLAADIEQIRAYIAEAPEDAEDKEAGDDIINAYIEIFKGKVRAYIAAKSRCISTMITGGSKFPVQRAEKANESERKRWEELEDFRDKFLNRTRRRFAKLTPPLERAKANLEQRENNHALMVEANKIIRGKKSSREEKIEALTALGFSEKGANQLLAPDAYGRLGFPAYAISNNKANITRLRSRVAELEAKEAKKDLEMKKAEFAGGYVQLNYKEDRVQIFNDEKPPSEVREKYKKSGFHWSPFFKCWQRQITKEAIYQTEKLLGVEFNKHAPQLIGSAPVSETRYDYYSDADSGL